jgi:FkbM family methyltransferase
MSPTPRLPPNLPLRLRVQFTVTQRVTALLKLLGLREAVIRGRHTLARIWRGSFERRGSERHSHPALYGMDSQLAAIIDRDGGCFVEAGGHDGYTQSNTYYLERFRGWHGMLVEPMPEMAAEAARNRPGAIVKQCALAPLDHPERYVEMEFGDLFSTISGLRDDPHGSWVGGGLVLGWRDHRLERVPARPLSDLLDEAQITEIDLLSLDVEGYEAHALRGLDLSRHAPMWILVEMHDLALGRKQIGEVLGALYVEHAQLSPVDVLYRRLDEHHLPTS